MGTDFKEGENMDLGFESVFSGFESFGSSSSSDLSTLVGSELDSTEVESSEEEEDDEFMAELTRQMADYMLQDDDDDDNKEKIGNGLMANFDSEKFNVCAEEDRSGEGIKKSTDSSLIKESNGYQSNPAFTAADQMQPIQLYQIENQPMVPLPNSGSMRTDKQDHKKMGIGPKLAIGGVGSINKYNYGMGYPPYVAGSGSGMRAVFLGGVGAKNASSGTGVFLPRGITPTPNQPPKKSGCSTVLIPTRVLQVLEQHFSNIKPPSGDSVGRSLKNGKRRDSTQEKGQEQSQPSRAATMDHQVSQLPQEWTY